MLRARRRGLRMPNSGQNREARRLKGVNVAIQNKTPQLNRVLRSLFNSQSTVRASDAEGHVRNNMLITSGACLLQCVGWLSRLLLPRSQLRQRFSSVYDSAPHEV